MTQVRDGHSSEGLGRREISGLSREIAWTYASLIATTGVTLLITGFAVRRLGLHDFGLFSLIGSLALFLNIFDFGLGLAVQRASAAEIALTGGPAQQALRREINACHGAYAALGMAGMTALVGGLMFGIWLVDSGHRGDDLLLTAFFSGLAVVGSTSTSAFVGALTGRRRFRSLALASVVGAAANFLVVLTMVGVLGAGVVGLALGQFSSILFNRIILGALIRREIKWLKIVPSRPRWTDLSKVASFTLPLLVLSIGGHIITVTDLIIVGSVVSASAVGLYRLGSMIPTLAVGILYKGYDTAFPAIAGTGAISQNEIIAFLTRLFGFVAGLGFGLLALLREDIVAIVLGRVSPTAASVLFVFCLVWIANVPVHGLALTLIARGKQRSFVPLVAIEMVANLVLTVILTPRLGAIGAAVATLISLAVSNLLTLPIILRRESEIEARKLVVTGVAHVGSGFLIAALAFVGFSWLEPSVLRIILSSGLAATIGAACGYVLLGQTGREMLRSTLARRNGDRSHVAIVATPTELGVGE